MKNPRRQKMTRAKPRIPGVSRRQVRRHAARLFRDVFAKRLLTPREWRLAEEDLARKLERTGF